MQILPESNGNQERANSGAVPRLLLSREEAAAALGIAPRTLDAIVSQGDLPRVQIGRRVLFSTEALRNWISRQEAISFRDRRTEDHDARFNSDQW